MTSSSLLDYAAGRASSPLAPHELRMTSRSQGFATRGAWPVDLLPAEALALDLARRGLSYRSGVGFVQGGDVVDADKVGNLAAEILDLAARTLDPHRVRGIERAASDVAIARHDHEYRAADLGLEREALEAFVDARDLITSAHLLPVTAAFVDANPCTDDATHSDRVALSLTAASLRTSRAARSRLAERLRALLPVPAGVQSSTTLAEAFLATLDDRATVRRSEAVSLWREAGSPGALTRTEFHALAESRWGKPRLLNGNPTFRPSESVPRPLPAVTVTVSPWEVATLARVDAAVAWVRERWAVLGVLSDAALVASTFDLDLDLADLALREAAAAEAEPALAS
jgi:hypothetical protein